MWACHTDTEDEQESQSSTIPATVAATPDEAKDWEPWVSFLY